MKKFIRLMVNGGFSKEEYKNIKPMILERNYTLWRQICPFIMIYFMLSLCFCFSVEIVSRNEIMYVLMSVIFGFASLILRQDYQKIKKWFMVLIYFLNIAFLGFATVIGVMFSPNFVAVTFMVLMVALPLLTIDRPVRLISMYTLMAILFSIVCLRYKSGETLQIDLYNTVCFWLISTALNTVMMRYQINTLFMKQSIAVTEAASRAKTQFLFNVSHDIRTPMNAIVGFTELAKRKIDDKEQVLDYLDKISVSSDQLLSLIDDVLDMSRIESGNMKYENTRILLPKLVENINVVVRTNMEMKGLRYEVESELTDDEIMCDRVRLNQILLNILSNSMKFTPEGGTVGLHVRKLSESVVRMMTREIDDHTGDYIYDEWNNYLWAGYGFYEFIITDTGIGMSEEFIQKIYEPFARAKSATESGISGTGLGMSIVKAYVDYLHGMIDITSTPGKGSRFRIVLPLLPAKKGGNAGRANAQTQTDSGQNSRACEPAQSAASKEASDNMQTAVLDAVSENMQSQSCDTTLKAADRSNIKILVAEDNFLNQQLIRDLLLDEGYSVEIVSDGADAVEAVWDGDYDVVLMDIQMPVMDGYEATKQIRRLGSKGEHILIFAMTANAFDSDRANAIDAGMNGHLAKPVDIDQLNAMLDEYLK